MYIYRIAFLTLSFAAITPVAPSAQQTARSQSDPRPTATAARSASSPRIDGRLDEAAWAAAQPVTEFIQQDPSEGLPASERTEVRILFDESALYIGARLFDGKGGEGVRTLLSRRDAMLDGAAGRTSDKLSIELDTFRERNGRIVFEINPSGVRGDSQNGDASYDPVWDAATRVDAEGWTAEIRIPLSQLRFPRDTAQSWGLQLTRTIDRKRETAMWAFWRKNEAGGPPYYGTLNGIAVSHPPRQVEVLPYVTSKSKFERPRADDPFHDTRDSELRAGGDLKVNLTSNLTLDATVNPDFGQVEVDPATLNLTVFETTFAEKRPFFVSNSQYLAFGGLSCINCSNVSGLGLTYSRRIGRSPQLGGLLSGRSAYVDMADATTILGAAKVTGRTGKALSVGILDAITDKTTAVYRSPGASEDARFEVEPATNYFIGRLRQDLRGGSTRVGGIATLLNRRLTNDDQVALLRSSAQAVGVDVDHRWSNRMYSFLARAALTNVEGDTSAIRLTQQSSARYYQRAGRKAGSDGLFDTSFDPEATSLSGYGLYGRIAKESGNWLWDAMYNSRSPGFEINDMGALSRADYHYVLGNVMRQWTTPTSWYRNLSASVGVQQQYNYEGDRNDFQWHTFVSVRMPNYWRFFLSGVHHPSVYDERLTRGGPTTIRYGHTSIFPTLESDPRSRVAWSFSTSLRHPIDNQDGDGYSLRSSLTLKPATNLFVSLAPSFQKEGNPQQYVTSRKDANAPPGFGATRYVFAKLEQTVFSLDTRVNATFTPTLSLELFAQPFVASGKYTGFREFVTPRSRSMFVYGDGQGSTIARQPGEATAWSIDPDGPGPSLPFAVGSPDFTTRSLRGNAVMRWEYRPGSTLYFVWTQRREGSSTSGDFDFGREGGALFDDRPVNIFQLKATWWLGR